MFIFPLCLVDLRRLSVFLRRLLSNVRKHAPAVPYGMYQAIVKVRTADMRELVRPGENTVQVNWGAVMYHASHKLHCMVPAIQLDMHMQQSTLKYVHNGATNASQRQPCVLPGRMQQEHPSRAHIQARTKLGPLGSLAHKPLENGACRQGAGCRERLASCSNLSHKGATVPCDSMTSPHICVSRSAGK